MTGWCRGDEHLAGDGDMGIGDNALQIVDGGGGDACGKDQEVKEDFRQSKEKALSV